MHASAPSSNEPQGAAAIVAWKKALRCPCRSPSLVLGKTEILSCARHQEHNQSRKQDSARYQPGKWPHAASCWA